MGQPAWAVPTPLTKYRIGDQAPTAIDTPLTGMGGPSVRDTFADKPWHPDSPLFWVGAIAAATFGLLAFSTSVRVGPAKAGVSLGD